MSTILLFVAMFTFQASAGVASLQGRVLDSTTNGPIRGASVLLLKFGASPKDGRIVTTAGDGSFVFENVSPGQYSVVATRTGYIRSVYGQGTSNAPATPIQIDAGRALIDIVITMMPTAVIVGAVFNQDGEPAVDVNVRAQRAVYQDGQRTMITVKDVLTNDLGEYRLSGLPPGRYFVSAVPPRGPRVQGDRLLLPTPMSVDAMGGTPAGTSMIPFQKAVELGIVDPAALAGYVYPEVYFAGATDPAAASLIDVAPGATFFGVNVTLVPTREGRIRGRVVNGKTGHPMAGVSVSVLRRSNQSRFSGQSTQVSPSGSFELRGLTPDSYVLTAGVDSGEGWMSAIAEVEASSTDISDVSLVLRHPLNLAGRVTIEGEAIAASSPDTSRLRVFLRSKMSRNRLADVQSNGVFTFSGTSGLVAGDEYSINLAELPPKTNWYLKAARLGTIDVLTSGIRLDYETNAQLELVISPNSATLDCEVVDEYNNHAPNTTLVVVPDTSRRHILDLYRFASTDSLGRVHLEGLVPGNYKIFAWREIEPGAWHDPAVIRSYEMLGQPVRLEENGRITIRVRAIRP